jgi:dUTP pyrophosphatase
MISVGVKKLRADAILPKYSHDGEFGDLAADLYAVEALTFATGDVRAISTGIALEFPPGYGALIADRSGLALKGLTTFAGVIDPGYRGELKVVAAYFGKEPLVMKAGDRVAQLRIVERLGAEFYEVTELGESERAHRGFGSTGS